MNCRVFDLVMKRHCVECWILLFKQSDFRRNNYRRKNEQFFIWGIYKHRHETFKIHTSNMESLLPLPLLPIPGRASYNASFSFDLLLLEIKWFLALLWFRYQVWIRHNASPSRVINMKIFFHVWILITFKRQNIIEVPWLVLFLYSKIQSRTVLSNVLGNNNNSVIPLLCPYILIKLDFQSTTSF